MGACQTNTQYNHGDVSINTSLSYPTDPINIHQVNYSGTILIKQKSGVALDGDCMSDRFSEIVVQRLQHIDTIVDSVLFDE
ncbi:hypothetical protein SS50377_20615 [Spironucleus salmonicida]|uniref:Uncharacterized protein n=1 Tax=Spironucleus salmonicida TaxID=348837 RepID=A0A9P8S1H2_9EUKA|nr:hypothetical protein SS50377_20615 [Spironucleus salmonicida]